MALLDISLVTRAMIRVVQAYVPESGVWTGVDPVPVSPLPPDMLDPGALGIQLYHISEDAQFKNQPAPGADSPPVRYTPMGLDLYYQLSAHTGDDDDSTYQAQLLLGLALKALHDYPVLTDETEVNEVLIFAEDCEYLSDADNRIRLTLQPIPHNEAMSFWTAGSTPSRLAAYYQASVILLEPEEPHTRVGRVLSYGVHTFVTGAPRLDGSENTLTISVPGTATSQELKLRPADVPSAEPGEPLMESRVIFTGIDLTGDESHLLIRSASWAKPLPVDASWEVVATPNRVLATVRETIETIDGEVVVLPGVHAAAVRVVRRRTMPDGSVRSFEQTSNGTPFTITPRINVIDVPDDASEVFTVHGYIFQHDDLRPEDLQVYLGMERLESGAVGALERGRFAVSDPSTLEFRLPEDFDPGVHVPFRLLINGAESAPRWIEVPS